MLFRNRGAKEILAGEGGKLETFRWEKRGALLKKKESREERRKARKKRGHADESLLSLEEELESAINDQE